MGWGQLGRNPFTWVAAGLALYLVSRNRSSLPNPPISPGPGNPPTTTTPCTYQYTSGGFSKSDAEKIARVKSYIVGYNAGAERTAVGMGYRGSDYVGVLASALVTRAGMFGIPVDILVAMSQRESSFNYWLSDVLVKTQIEKGGAIGPLQVKPVAFRQVGFTPEFLIGWQPDDNRIYYAVSAGAKYLAWTKSQLPNYSWCDVLQSYYCGVNGFLRNGCRNDPYVSKIIGWANQYTDLKA